MALGEQGIELETFQQGVSPFQNPRRAAVERFTKEFAPLVTSGLPGTTGYTTGRPPVREVFAYWPALVAKSAVAPLVEVL